MGQRSGARAGRQNELLQAGQAVVVYFQCLVELADRLGLEQLKAGDRQLTTQVEQLVLHIHQQSAHLAGHVFAQQHADVGVELIDIAHGMHAQAVLRDAGVVAQAGGAVVAGAGGNLGESLRHKAPGK